MLLCNFKAPSGSPSSLYNELQSRFGDDSATRIWNYIRSEEFGKKFLDGETYQTILDRHSEVLPDTKGEIKINLDSFKFELDVAHNIPTDANGEPTIDWVLKNIDTPKEQIKQDTPKGPKIISGGQTGVDRLGLEIAKELGLTTGGIAPKGYKTETGADLTLKEFGLTESTSSNYTQRTEQNVIDSDGTILFGDMSSAGSKQTINFLKKHSKPYIVNPTSEQIKEFSKDKKIINIAGNRGSKLTQDQITKFKDALRKGLQSTTQSVVKGEQKSTTKSTLTPIDFGKGTKESRKPYTDSLSIVKDFYENARNNPTQTFDASSFSVKDIKKPGSSGYSPIELADLFASFPIPANIKFGDLFSSLITNTATFQMNNLDLREVPFLKYNEAMLQDVLDEYFIPIKNADGTKTGETFTSEQQVAGVDAIVTNVWYDYSKDPKISVGQYLSKGGTVYNRMQAYATRYEQKYNLPPWVSNSQADAWTKNIRQMLHSWDDFVRRALYKLESYGLSVKGRSAIADIKSLINNEGDDVLQEQGARALSDWADSSFELDPKDTAHTRIKLFLASIRDVTVGEEREPHKLKLAFNNPELRDRILGKNKILGTKTQTIRTAEQVKDLGIIPGQQYLTTIDDNGEKVKFRVTAGKRLVAEDLTDPNIQSLAAEEGLVPQIGDVLLGLERWVPKQDTLLPRENFLGFPNLVDFETLFQSLLETLNGVPNTLDATLQALDNEGKNFKPVFLEVARQLRGQSEDIQREFVKVMSKQYQEFSILLFSKRKDGFMDMTEINANRGSAINSIVDHWRENQKNAEVVTRNAEGNLVINNDVAQELLGRLGEIQGIYASGNFPHVDILKDFAKDILNKNGIVMSDKALDYLFTKTSIATINTSVAGGIHDQFQVTTEGKPKGIFSALVMKLAGITQEESRSESDSNYLLNNNPLYTENTSIRVLAKLAYRFAPQTSTGVHKNSQGKNIYAFGYNSHLSNTTQKLKNDNEFLESMNDTFLGNRSWLLQRFLTDSEARDAFNLRYVDGLKQAYRRNSQGIERTDMSPREQLLFSLGQFQNQKSRTGNFLSLTHSDKQTTPLFMGIEKFDPNSLEAKQAIFDTFLGEFERVSHWYTETKQNNNPTPIDAYNKGGGLFYFIPQLNYDFLNKLVEGKHITKDELSLVWAQKGIPNTRTSIASLKPFILKIFENYWMRPEVNKLVQILKNEGFYEGLVDHAYFKRNATKAGLILNQNGTFRDFNTQEAIEEKDALERFMPWMARDYLTNYFLMNTALSALYFGDPALTFKGKSTVDYISVAETMTEYQKRLAKDIAPGQDPTWDSLEETYQAITLQDDERVHDYLESLPKYNGKEINGTDAQEFTTVREHLYVMKALGMINPQVYKEMIDIIDQGLNRSDKYYEFTKDSHKDVVMQIMKPVSVSHDFDEIPKTATIHYIKSSSLPLYPPMTQPFQIDQLRQAMEGEAGKPETHLPRANFISAKKMGAPAGKGVKVFDKEGNLTIKPGTPEWNQAIQTIPRAGFRIQQEVPYDETKEEILTGSQMNKLFTEGISGILFTLPGETESVFGDKLKAIKEDTRKQLIQLQLDDYLDKVGAERVGDTIKIVDKTKLLGILEDEALTRSYPPNDLIMLRRRIENILPTGETSVELSIPLFFNPSSDRFESLLMSLIKKVGQVYYPGKSYIQASSSGFRFQKGKTFDELRNNEREGIIWAPGYDGSELKIMTKEDGKVKAAQVLLPFNFLIKNKQGESELANADNFITTDPKTGKKTIDLEKIPQDLLQLIAFRIPTQKQNSMLPMEVAGFLPANMGDTIVVPAAITTQMGSDFDVDKLYVYRRPYTKDAQGFVADKGTEKSQLLSKYFDIMWTVLTHPDMYDTVLQPLDKDDLKAEAERAKKSENINNFYSPTTQLNDFNSQKDAKAMIGITSQFVTAAVWGENMNMYAGTRGGEEGSGAIVFREGEPYVENRPEIQPDGFKYIPEGSTEERHAYWISHRAEGVYHNEITDKAEKRTKIDDIVTLQNELLDHAKSRTIDHLNINLQTVYVALAGVTLSDDQNQKASWKHIALFLRQPAIQELTSKLAKSQDSLSDTYDPNLLDTLISEIGFKFSGDVDNVRPDMASPLDIDKMKEVYRNTQEQKEYQIGLLFTFKKLDKIGREMGMFQRTFNQDPKGPGKSMVNVLTSLADEDRVKNSAVIANGDDLFNSEQGFIHSAELETARDVYRDILPYETISGLVNNILEESGRRGFDADMQKDIVQDFKSYVFSNTELGLSENSNVDRFRLLYGTPEEGSLAKRVWEAQNSWGQNNYFLRRLSAQQAESINNPSYIFYQQAQTSSLDDQENSAAFLQLLTSKDEVARKLAEDLVRYAYVTGGIAGSFSFIRYIPADYLVSLPFASKLREVSKQLEDPESHADYDDFTEQWIRHNPQTMRKVSPQTMIEGKTVPGEMFSLKSPTPENGILSIGRFAPTGYFIYPNYLSFFDKEDNTWKLYKQEPLSVSDYRRIDTLGNSYISEYSHQQGYQRSIFTDNRALINPSSTLPAIRVSQQVRERSIQKHWSSILSIDKNTYKGAEVTALLSRLGKNSNIESSLQLLATELAELINKTQRVAPLSLEFRPDKGGNQAGYLDATTGKIVVFPSKDELPGDVVRTILHEAIHSITSIYTRQGSSVKENHPQLQAAIAKVEEVRVEAREALLKVIEKSEFTVEQVQAAAQGKGLIPGPLEALAHAYYATTSVDEFMSGVFEDRAFQVFLNSRTSKYENKSLLSRVVGFIAKIIGSIAEDLGITVKPSSMLEIGLERSFNVLDLVTAEAEQLGKPAGVLKAIADTYFNGKQSIKGTWIINDTNLAKEIKSKIEDEFSYINVTYTEITPTQVVLHAEPKFEYKLDLAPAEYKTSTNPIDNLYGKVQEQMQEIRASIAKNKKNLDVLRQNQLLIELRVLANDLKATQDLDKAKELANYQLNWATNVRNKYNDGKPVSINQVMTAYRLVNIWTGVLNLVYNSSARLPGVAYDPEFVSIQGRAEELSNDFTSSIMKQVLNELSQDGLTDDDYKSIKDMPAAEAKFLDISRSSSKVVQEVALNLQNAHRSYLEKGQRLLKEIADFEKEARELAKGRGQKVQDFYENFMQDGDQWGLVTRFTSAFYSWKSRQRNKLNEKLEQIESTIPDASQRAAATKSAWSAYWRNIDKNAGFVDVRVVYDPETGEEQTTTAATKYMKEMEDEYGPKLTKELLAESKAKYQQYLQDKEDIYELYDTQVEEGQMTEREAQDAKTAWDLQYSPGDKITSRTIHNNNFSSMTEKYLVMVPHKEATDFNGNTFFDEKYSRIKEDESLSKFYDKIQSFMDRFTGNLPYYLDSKLGPNFLAAIQKDQLNSIADVPKYLAGAGKHIVDMLTASSYEEFMQTRSRKDIPILYMQNPFEGIVKPAPDAPEEAWKTYEKLKAEKLKSYTRDLSRILELFGLMSQHYQTFSEARDAIDLGEEVIKKAHDDLQRGTRQVEKDGKIVTVKSSLENTLGALEYTKDVLMYRRAQHLEGKLGDITRKQQKGEAVKKLQELRVQEQELEEKLNNNEITPTEYSDKIKEIDLEKQKYEIRKLYASKIGDTLITWTQLKALSYNPLSAVNNLAFGLITATIVANQNQEYGWKEARKAFGIMMNATGRSIGLARITGNQSAMNQTAQKILNIMDRMNIMGELNETAYKKSNLPQRKSGLRNVVSPYQMLRTGDYFVKGLNTVATLLKAKVTIEGKEINVWDAIDSDGNWKYKDMPEWQSEDPAEQKSWNKLRNKVIGVNKIVMGNQDKSSPIWAKKSILFRLIGQFRLSWLAELAASRFEGEREDLQLGRTRKGRYRTYMDLGFLGSLGTLGRQLLSTLPGVGIDPYNQRRLKNGKLMSDTDKANMRGNLAELSWFILLFGAAKVIGALAGGADDDDNKKWLWLLANMATRSYQDVGLYSNPTIFDQILGTPAPALSTIRDTAGFLRASLKWATDDDYEFQQWLLKFTRMGFPIPQSTLINRFNTMMTKDISTIQR